MTNHDRNDPTVNPSHIPDPYDRALARVRAPSVSRGANVDLSVSQARLLHRLRNTDVNNPAKISGNDYKTVRYLETLPEPLIICLPTKDGPPVRFISGTGLRWLELNPDDPAFNIPTEPTGEAAHDLFIPTDDEKQLLRNCMATLTPEQRSRDSDEAATVHRMQHQAYRYGLEHRFDDSRKNAPKILARYYTAPAVYGRWRIRQVGPYLVWADVVYALAKQQVHVNRHHLQIPVHPLPPNVEWIGLHGRPPKTGITPDSLEIIARLHRYEVDLIHETLKTTPLIAAAPANTPIVPDESVLPSETAPVPRASPQPYTLTNTRTGQTLIGHTRNIAQTRSQLLSDLRGGKHRNHDLQRDFLLNPKMFVFTAITDGTEPTLPEIAEGLEHYNRVHGRGPVAKGPRAGFFTLTNTHTTPPRVFSGKSSNLAAVKSQLYCDLRAGRHKNADLQADFTALGSGAFVFAEQNSLLEEFAHTYNRPRGRGRASSARLPSPALDISPKIALYLETTNALRLDPLDDADLDALAATPTATPPEEPTP